MKYITYDTEEEHESAIMEDMAFNAQRLRIRTAAKEKGIDFKIKIMPDESREQRIYSLNANKEFIGIRKRELSYFPIDSSAAAGS